MTGLGATAGFLVGGGGGVAAALLTDGVASPLAVAGAAGGWAFGGTVGLAAAHSVESLFFSEGSGPSGSQGNRDITRWAKKYGLNANSSTTQNLYENRATKVEDFISKYRKGSIRQEFPSEHLDQTLDEALKQGGSKVRKLLTSNEYLKGN